MNKIIKRQNREVFILIILSWLTYSFCQMDFYVTAISAFVLFASLLKELFISPSQKTVVSFSSRLLVGLTFGFSIFYKIFVVEPPDNSISFVPIIVPAAQVTFILLTLYFWFQFSSKRRIYIINLLCFLTVATSINVPLNSLTVIFFWTFCIYSIAIVILRLYRPYDKNVRDVMRLSKNKSKFDYLFPVILTMISILLFSLIIKTVKLGDEVFLDLISNYMTKRHFNFFNGTLSLVSSGNNRFDMKPVLEIKRRDKKYFYLVGQVFERYKNGIWFASVSQDYEKPNNVILNKEGAYQLVMFEYLQRVIPTPREITSISSKQTDIEKDSNEIFYSLDRKIPIVYFNFKEQVSLKTIDDKLRNSYTQIDDKLKVKLKQRVDKIVNQETDPYLIAEIIEKFFKDGFKYDLDIDYEANNEGILDLIDNRRSAYCSYFATAMTLMLRSENIPARMTAGFLATELSGFNNDKLIVRGRDAHAWVEVLLPIKQKETNADKYVWVRFDPTPAILRAESLNKLNNDAWIADWIWCSQKRLKAALLDLDPKFLVRILMVVIGLLVFEEFAKKLYLKFIKKEKMHDLHDQLKSENADCLRFYLQLEGYLNSKFRIKRKESETDGEFLNRIKNEKQLTEETFLKIGSFLSKYHHVRFGFDHNIDLENEIKQII